MCDTRLPIGARKSPAIFNHITQAVARSLRQAGHHVVVYMDDFFVCGPDFLSCKATYDALILKLRDLGFQINWKNSWTLVNNWCSSASKLIPWQVASPWNLRSCQSYVAYYTPSGNGSGHHVANWNLWREKCAGPAMSWHGVAPTSDSYMC